MIKKFLIAVVLLLYFNMVQAGCGQVPELPAELSSKSISSTQLLTMDETVETFFERLENYKACLDVQVTKLDVESESYDDDFAELVKNMNQAEEKKTLAITQYNALVKNATDQADDFKVEDAEGDTDEE